MSEEVQIPISPVGEPQEQPETPQEQPGEPVVNELDTELVVTQKRRTSPVKFVMNDGKEWKCILKELEGPDREKYIDMQATRVQFDNKGRPTGLKPLPGMDQWLIIRSLVTQDFAKNLPIIITKGEAKAKEFIGQFGGYLQGEMAKRVRMLSGITEGFDEASQKKNKEAAKND